MVRGPWRAGAARTVGLCQNSRWARWGLHSFTVLEGYGGGVDAPFPLSHPKFWEMPRQPLILRGQDAQDPQGRTSPSQSPIPHFLPVFRYSRRTELVGEPEGSGCAKSRNSLISFLLDRGPGEWIRCGEKQEKGIGGLLQAKITNPQVTGARVG